MTDREAVDFLKKARITWSVPRASGKYITQMLYIEAMSRAIHALEEKAENEERWNGKMLKDLQKIEGRVSRYENRVYTEREGKDSKRISGQPTNL